MRLDADELPRAFIIECVANLGHQRKVDKEMLKGTQTVTKDMEACGYHGEFRRVDPRQFALPQSRNRVYAIFILGGIRAEQRQSAQAKAAMAMSFLNKSRAACIEDAMKVRDLHGSLPV